MDKRRGLNKRGEIGAGLHFYLRTPHPSGLGGRLGEAELRMQIRSPQCPIRSQVEKFGCPPLHGVRARVRGSGRPLSPAKSGIPGSTSWNLQAIFVFLSTSHFSSLSCTPPSVP